MWWFLLYISMNSHRYTCVLSSWTPLPPLSSSVPSKLPQYTSFGCSTSCIKFTLVIYFTYGNVYVSILFSQIIPTLPSPVESKNLFIITVPSLLPCMWNHWYHLFKFHLYVLIYSICLFLSDPFYSV